MRTAPGRWHSNLVEQGPGRGQRRPTELLRCQRARALATRPARPAYFCFGQADSACVSASLEVIAPVDQRLSPSQRALLPTPTGIESEASISTVVSRDWSSLVAR